MKTFNDRQTVDLIAQLKVSIASYNIALRDLNNSKPHVRVSFSPNHDGTQTVSFEEVYYENQRCYIIPKP